MGILCTSFKTFFKFLSYFKKNFFNKTFYKRKCLKVKPGVPQLRNGLCETGPSSFFSYPSQYQTKRGEKEDPMQRRRPQKQAKTINARKALHPARPCAEPPLPLRGVAWESHPTHPARPCPQMSTHAAPNLPRVSLTQPQLRPQSVRPPARARPRFRPRVLATPPLVHPVFSRPRSRP